MFYILDGRSQFYQWDIDRKIVVEDNSITQVHFCNKTDDCSLVCEVYDLDGLRVANVPNILLQEDWRINVYAYDSNYTKHCETYDVVRRSKPADYVYTETEILNFDTLLERMDNIDATIGERVEDYLNENPPTTDLTGFATEEYVVDAVEEGNGYHFSSDTQLAQEEIELINRLWSNNSLERPITIDGKPVIAFARTGSPGLVVVANSSYYNDGGYFMMHYYLYNLTDGKLITKAEYSDNAVIHATEVIIPRISSPTCFMSRLSSVLEHYNKNMALKSEIPSIEGLATEQYVREQVEAIDIPEADLTGYATEKYVDDAVAAVELLPGPAGKDGADGKDYVLTEEDKAEIAGMIDVPSGGGGIVEEKEVYVGTEAPTDPDVKLWVNPDAQVAYPTMEQVQAAITDALGAIGVAEEGAY